MESSKQPKLFLELFTNTDADSKSTSSRSFTPILCVRRGFEPMVQGRRTGPDERPAVESKTAKNERPRPRQRGVEAPAFFCHEGRQPSARDSTPSSERPYGLRGPARGTGSHLPLRAGCPTGRCTPSVQGGPLQSPDRRCPERRGEMVAGGDGCMAADWLTICRAMGRAAGTGGNIPTECAAWFPPNPRAESSAVGSSLSNHSSVVLAWGKSSGTLEPAAISRISPLAPSIASS